MNKILMIVTAVSLAACSTGTVKKTDSTAADTAVVLDTVAADTTAK
jgi:uncharacterized lipoprotein YmbA